MIFFDITKAGTAAHRSGLTRVSSRLRTGLGADATEIAWDPQRGTFRAGSAPVSFQPEDWVLTPELFSEEERPGFTAFLRTRPCRIAAIFHDAIPLKLPHFTWPQSVARHPGYLKLLASFDRIWAVSRASRDELVGFWHWQGIAQPPPVDVLALGADFNSQPRVAARSLAQPATLNSQRPLLLCTGILEPRKNQAFLIEVCAELWREGLAFELHLVGRVNPHFGKPILAQIRTIQRAHPRRLQFHEAASDAALGQLYARARATVFPTIAEGCGLPVLESLWLGVPCVCSDLPVLRENADGGGCLAVPANDHSAWKSALTTITNDDTLHAKLTTEATSRPLPSWSSAAQSVLEKQ